MWVVTGLIAIYERFIDKNAMEISFFLVLNFNHIVNKLILNLKEIIYAKKKSFFDLLILGYIQSHNYNIYNNKKDIKICFLSPFSSIICLLFFILLANDINDFFCKLFLAVLMYQIWAKNNDDELQNTYFNAINE